MEVVAYKKVYTSPSASITVTTDGKLLPRVPGLVCIEFVHMRACACTLNEYSWYIVCNFVVVVFSFVFSPLMPIFRLMLSV